MQPVLEINDLTTTFFLKNGPVKAVDRVSLTLNQGQSLALVGESGCGKTMLALSILGLVPAPPGKITAGRVLFNGQDLTRLPEKDLRSIRGNHISMIFQEPMSALNPVFRVGAQISETLIFHKKMTMDQARAKSIELLKMVGIPAPEKRYNDFPHQLSGGMRQRIIIAMALACSPRVILADEPTTALDVTIQAQILDLIKELQDQSRTSTVLITHDLGVVAQICHEMAVMYSGRIVEYGEVSRVLAQPGHPYTRGLLASLPRLDRDAELSPIPGTVPEISHLPQGCHFHPRCPEKMDKCAKAPPPVFHSDSEIRCWLYEK
ncbi:ABC transporter ATP-binding protein [Desulfonatronovibrio hydrogenovorans]|uniref:ABC transporter ATP-binding protein n=1 Tax=Desulfonatronovibrio hydrogenovorans TaxID=53245 RepID=UPI000490F848|nr:ABC transporter ATP-binding protein [Desulfonatronovibrio hydrogenovorans]